MIHGILLTFSLIVASAVDIRNRKIPNIIPVITAISAAISDISATDAVLGAVFAFLLLIPLLPFIGGADLKLVVSLGLNLGINRVFIVAISAFTLSLLYGKLSKVTSVPFAPFLTAAYIFVLILWR